MKHLRILSVFALALAFSASAFAETQTVKVSGSVDAKWIYRENLDLREGNGAAVIPVGGTMTGNPDPTTSLINSDDATDWFMSTVQVEIAADLTDNVSVVINLFNQRDWNASRYSAADYVTPGVSTVNTANEFDLGVDLAYVTLKEAFYAPLTLTIGRQDIEFGRGLILGNFNVQDPNVSIIADEFSAVTSFDAARATLDFEPWTLDLVYANIAQNDANDPDDRDLFWLNVNYMFSEYNAVWEAYVAADLDKSTADNAAVATRAHANDTYVVGTRAQFDPVSNMTLGAELAYQWGNQTAAASAAQFGLNREAYLFDIFGEYRWSDHAYKPYVGLEYFFTSGDDTTSTGTFEGWNGLYRSPTFGSIHDYLETYYQTALVGDTASNTNLQTFFISGGFAPMEDLKVDGKFYWFWTDEDIINTTAGGSQNVGTDLGTELDVNVTYDYTEDVTFSLGLAWFFPGDVYGDAVSASTVGGSANNGSLNETATQAVAGINVTF